MAHSPERRTLRALCVSDKVIPFIYSPTAKERFGHVDLVLSCGDLPYYYLEYIISTLDLPLYFVRGNHANVLEYTQGGPRSYPLGGTDLDMQVMGIQGMLFAGFEGSIRYNQGPFQYSDREMHLRAARMAPRLVLNRLIRGRYLDVLVTHSPPLDVNDQPDRPHRGFAALRWFVRWFKPAYLLHGHIHLYHPGTHARTVFARTEIINCYGYRVLELIPPLGMRPAGGEDGR